MMERIIQETDAANLNNAVLSTADKKLSSSLYCVLALTMTDESAMWRDRSSQVVGGVSARHR